MPQSIVTQSSSSFLICCPDVNSTARPDSQKDQRLRVMSRWAQFVALGLGQLAGLQSLRDIFGNLCVQPHKL